MFISCHPILVCVPPYTLRLAVLETVTCLKPSAVQRGSMTWPEATLRFPDHSAFRKWVRNFGCSNIRKLFVFIAEGAPFQTAMQRGTLHSCRKMTPIPTSHGAGIMMWGKERLNGLAVLLIAHESSEFVQTRQAYLVR